MAITFTTGTINQADAPSVGQAMAERIRDDAVAHIAWDLVEEFTAAGGTCRWYVLKCLAAQSGLPLDFYVVMSRTLSTGELRWFICEDYVAGTHTAKYYAPGAYSSQFLMDASGRHTVGYVLDTSPPAGSGGGTPGYTGWTPSGTSSKWWLCVAEDGFTAAFNGASNGFVHAGTYIPLCDMPIAMPIQIMGSGGSLGSQGALTRNPAMANVTWFATGLMFDGGAGTSSSSGQRLGFDSDLRYNDKLNSNARSVAEQGMTVFSVSLGDADKIGYALGKHKRMRVTTKSLPTGTAFGDAYIMQNRLWVPYSTNDGRFWDTGVASS